MQIVVNYLHRQSVDIAYGLQAPLTERKKIMTNLFRPNQINLPYMVSHMVCPV